MLRATDPDRGRGEGHVETSCDLDREPVASRSIDQEREVGTVLLYGPDRDYYRRDPAGNCGLHLGPRHLFEKKVFGHCSLEFFGLGPKCSSPWERSLGCDFLYATPKAGPFKERPMRGRMMESPLLISDLIEHAGRVHGDQQIVTRTVEGPIAHSTWGELLRLVDTLPMGATGKVQKTKLREEYAGC